VSLASVKGSERNKNHHYDASLLWRAIGYCTRTSRRERRRRPTPCGSAFERCIARRLSTPSPAPRRASLANLSAANKTVLDREDPDCEPCERQDASIACTRSLLAVCVSLVLSAASGLPAEHARYEWTSWSFPSPPSLSFQYLGVPIPALRSPPANLRRYGWLYHA
jgi:hypothetical protein